MNTSWGLLSLEGAMFLLRWMHYFFGVTWIGLLYYFNFVQGPFFAETDAATKSGAIQKLVPRALWWFRYAALWTVVMGILIVGYRGGHQHMFAGNPSWTIWILTGSALGLIMAANVWFIIWPNQRIVIASTTAVAGGGAADPRAAGAGARAGIASRTNVLFSLPMLFFMGAASHLTLNVRPDASLVPLTIVLALIIGALELNAIKGKMGPLASIKGVVHFGVLLLVVLYVVIELLTK